MNKGKGYSMMWSLVLLLVSFLAGCGGNDTKVQSSANAITAYSLVGATGTIDETDKTIAVTVPYNTDVKASVATFATTGASVQVGAAVQTSGTTANNFTGSAATPVLYTVTAADSSKQTYAVTVTVALISDKAISAFSFGGVAGAIDETGNTVLVTVPNGTDTTKLVATFATSGTSVTVGTTIQKSGVTENNFTRPVLYTVTAADGSAPAQYTVTVILAEGSAKSITAYSIAGKTGVVDETAKTIKVSVPTGTSLKTLVATFTATGTSVKVGTALQKSGTTANDFTNPVAYSVTAADGSAPANYTVTVTVAASSAKAITAYSLAGIPGTIAVATNDIKLTVPNGTNIKALVATFTTTGASVMVGTAVQKSGTTPNDFTNPVAYTVTAADGSAPAKYTVTVALAPVKGPAPVLLGTAGDYVILAESGVSTVPASTITGDIGLSPAAASYLTGFSLTEVGTTSATSTQVTGSLYAADMTAPTSTKLTTAVSDMGAAYTDAAGRPTPDFTNHGAGEIGGLVLLPGLYKWTGGVGISSNVTISGGPNDVWIFQIPGNLAMSPAKTFIMAGGAKAKNIFWQVAGTVEIGTGAHFEGIILSQTSITLGTGASMNGRALAQTAVILNACTVTKPN